MDAPEYMAWVARQLVRELEPIADLKEVTRNTELLGAYTEAAVRRLVRRIVHPLHVSTGAVIDYPLPPMLRQMDVIIWAPFPAPGLFEVDGFALIPRSSSFGVLEIKRSNYSRVDTELEELAARTSTFVTDRGGASRDDARNASLGIVCVLDGPPSERLNRLLQQRRAVAIFEKTGEQVLVRSDDVLTLVNTLHFISWRYRMQSSGPSYPQLVTEADRQAATQPSSG